MRRVLQCVVIIIGGTSIPGINIMTGMMAVMVTMMVGMLPPPMIIMMPPVI